jgi:hypothetical protein
MFMKNTTCLFALLIVLIILFSVLPLHGMQNTNFDKRSVVVKGELLIKLKQGENIEAFLSSYVAHSTSIRVKRTFHHLKIFLITYDHTAFEPDEMLNKLRTHSSVLVVQLNHRNHINLRNSIPNDTRFAEQWALNNTGQSGGVIDADIDAVEAWDLSLSRGGVTHTNERPVISVIDTNLGITHQDILFFKNTDEIPENGIDDDGNEYIDDYDGWNTFMQNDNLTDGIHGTRVSSIVGAVGNNDLGMIGINWNTEILPVTFGPIGTEDDSQLVEAYDYVLGMRQLYDQTNGERGAFVVATNLSWGVRSATSQDYPLWCQLYDDLGSHGILGIASTDNIGVDVDIAGDMPSVCPSSYLIVVNNTTHTDGRDPDAAWGNISVDLGASGTIVLAAQTISGNSEYAFVTGTSFAAPHVAGAVVQIFSTISAARLQEYKNSPATIALAFKDDILDGVDPISDLQNKTVTGGCLNLYNALLNALEDDPNAVIVNTNTTIPDGTVYEGQNIFVLAGAMLTINGTVTFKKDAFNAPSNLFLIGNLAGPATAKLLFKDGSELLVRTGSSTTAYLGTYEFEGNNGQGTNSCIIAEQGATVTLATGSTIRSRKAASSPAKAAPSPSVIMPASATPPPSRLPSVPAQSSSSAPAPSSRSTGR